MARRRCSRRSASIRSRTCSSRAMSPACVVSASMPIDWEKSVRSNVSAVSSRPSGPPAWIAQVRSKPPMRPTVQVRRVRSRAARRIFVSKEAPAILRCVIVRPSTSMMNASPRVGVRRARSAVIAAIRASACVWSCRASRICRLIACWSSICAACWRRSRAISLSSPALRISRLSPEAIALAIANWLACPPSSSRRRMVRSPDNAASMNRALRSLFCHIVASIEPSVA